VDTWPPDTNCCEEIQFDRRSTKECTSSYWGYPGPSPFDPSLPPRPGDCEDYPDFCLPYYLECDFWPLIQKDPETQCYVGGGFEFLPGEEYFNEELLAFVEKALASNDTSLEVSSDSREIIIFHESFASLDPIGLTDHPSCPDYTWYDTTAVAETKLSGVLVIENLGSEPVDLEVSWAILGNGDWWSAKVGFSGNCETLPQIPPTMIFDQNPGLFGPPQGSYVMSIPPGVHKINIGGHLNSGASLTLCGFPPQEGQYSSLIATVAFRLLP
jgi:hypothetical protein